MHAPQSLMYLPLSRQTQKQQLCPMLKPVDRCSSIPRVRRFGVIGVVRLNGGGLFARVRAHSRLVASQARSNQQKWSVYPSILHWGAHWETATRIGEQLERESCKSEAVETCIRTACLQDGWRMQGTGNNLYDQSLTLVQPQQVHDIKKFLEIARRKDATRELASLACLLPCVLSPALSRRFHVHSSHHLVGPFLSSAD